MNNKGQMDLHPFSFVGAFLGGLFAVYMANQMNADVIMKVMVFAITAIVCFFVTNLIITKE